MTASGGGGTATFDVNCWQIPALPRCLTDFADLREQPQRHRHVTLQLHWEEYREKNPHGYCYSYSCELYERWRRKQDLVLRQEHKR